MPKMIWKSLKDSRRGHTGPGECLFVGHLLWTVGVCQPHKREAGDDAHANWEVWMNLPGIKVYRKHHETLASGKAEVERLVGLWFKWVNEEEKPNGQREIA